MRQTFARRAFISIECNVMNDYNARRVFMLFLGLANTTTCNPSGVSLVWVKHIIIDMQVLTD
jgi:hypothetical protein